MVSLGEPVINPVSSDRPGPERYEGGLSVDGSPSEDVKAFREIAGTLPSHVVHAASCCTATVVVLGIVDAVSRADLGDGPSS